jgi:hypothetical protein
MVVVGAVRREGWAEEVIMVRLGYWGGETGWEGAWIWAYYFFVQGVVLWEHGEGV